MNAKWSVLAVYENEAAREVAMRFCDGLVQRFWPEFSLELNWSNWSDLENAKTAREVQQQVATADLILIACSPRGVLPTHFSWWLELALRHRGEREGVLVGLPLPETELSAEAAGTQVYLRKLAHRNGMDYLTTVPESLPRPEPESPESYNTRATQMTSVLDTILHHSSVPPRML
jgi:hypothetical protein